MKTFCFVNHYRKLLRKVTLRNYCSKPNNKNPKDIENIRNIGILAHIDAG